MADVTEPTTWNGMVLPWGNRRALQWAFIVGQRLDSLKFHAAARLVLQSLALHSDIDREKTNLCFPGVPLIAKETGLHRSHVTQIVKELEAAGIVSVEQVSGKSNRYRLRPEIDGHQWSTRRPARPLVTDDPSSETTSPLVRDDGYPSSETTPPLVSDDPNTYSEDDQVKTGKEDEQATAAPLPGRSAPLGQGIDPDDLDDRKPAQPAMQKPNPTGQHLLRQQAQEFAVKYWRFLGARGWEESAARNRWAGTFLPLIEAHGLDTIKAAVRFAKNHERLGKLLARYKGSDDSAQWLVDNFGDILSQRAAESERASKKRPSQPDYRPVNTGSANVNHQPAEIGIDPTW